jgi:putative PIN family toxin of toxin-antitoxin system
VSAFLTPNGLCDQLLRQGRRGAFFLSLSDDILAETRKVLLADEDLREDYPYSDQDVAAFIYTIRGAADLGRDIPPLPGITRDPNDDMVVACALAADAGYLITRDKDLLALGTYQNVQIIRPEEFMGILRQQSRKL